MKIYAFMLRNGNCFGTMDPVGEDELYEVLNDFREQNIEYCYVELHDMFDGKCVVNTNVRKRDISWS